MLGNLKNENMTGVLFVYFALPVWGVHISAVRHARVFEVQSAQTIRQHGFAI
jgi:hypothetical protein